MTEKNLRILIYIAGIVCLYAFLAVRIFPLTNFVLLEKMDPETKDFSRYGDLYYFSCISEFKEEFPHKIRRYRHSEDNPVIHEADILTYGDSFYDIYFTKSIPEKLSDTLKMKVYSYVSQDPTHSNPLCLLTSSNYSYQDNSRYLIYETVERSIPAKFTATFTTNCTTTERSGFYNVYESLLGFIFRENAENLYEVLLKHSYFTSRIYSAIASIKFNLFGYISPLTVKYKTGKQPWLFYDKEYNDDPGGFYYQYTEDEIRRFADNIEALGDSLSNLYNLELVFMPVPTKYTLYHKFINNDPYNELLPRLFKELDRRNINYIDVYHVFKNHPDTLYYGTDTHWNPKGIDIALNVMMERLDLHYSLTLKQSMDIHREKYQSE